MDWALVAHKDGELRGVISPELGLTEVGKFLAEMCADGCSITSTKDEAAYHALLATMGQSDDRTNASTDATVA
jgi:hypothetical protein